MGLKEGREDQEKRKKEERKGVLVYMKNIRRQGQRNVGKAGRERKREGWTDGGSVCVCEDFSFLIAYWTR